MPLMKMTPTVLKNLFSKPGTRLYPAVKREPTEATRGKVEVEIEKCIFCGMCSRKCPTAEITVNRAEKKWEIERFGCLACGLCVISCPKKCILMEHDYTSPNGEKYTDSYSLPEIKSEEDKNAD